MTKAKIRQSPKLPAETRRDQLLNSACRLFADKGYEVTSTEEIARHAGLTKGALYFHFKSKEDILLARMKSVDERYQEQFHLQGLDRTTPERYFRTIFAVKAAGGLPDLKDIADVGIQAMKIPRLRQYMRKAHRGHVRDFVNAIDPSLGYSRKELEQMGVFILAVFHGLCGLHWLDPKLVHLRGQVELFESFFANGLKRSLPGARTTKPPRNGARAGKAA